MSREEKDLQTIVYYCKRIESYIDRHGDSEDNFLDDEEFQEGCAFCLVQIGEATARLSEDFKELTRYIDWNSIKGLRNILVHRYGSVWLVGIWQTITEEVPVLKDLCLSLLKSLEEKE